MTSAVPPWLISTLINKVENLSYRYGMFYTSSHPIPASWLTGEESGTAYLPSSKGFSLQLKRELQRDPP
ncbi:MAG: hypothetical protein D5R97_07390 [Candidatus Syntrophonatronum acetioxidans]|uniref:Uncharacterized protein n=1 Tax=Candidatus Syntrophonatronum acetioxidans TaxID=1795816 RepID=A0A424YC07_9FIRM|nr:MAG: hypothetical protein D5R97_07390 [Candidatus Syntrophonatronum acetioxidans]